ncbi:hypothetical protein CYLTODRAFT_360828, partial [Cylindrobasidium torrendii FP15055 ss-10]
NADCKPKYNWMKNEAGQSPCLVWARVVASCETDSDVNVVALPPNSRCNLPEVGNEPSNACSCSWASYNLMSACTFCKGLHGSVDAYVIIYADIAGRHGGRSARN